MNNLYLLKQKLEEAGFSFLDDWYYDFRTMGCQQFIYSTKIVVLSTNEVKEKSFPDIIDVNIFGPEADRDSIKLIEIMNSCRGWLLNNLSQLIG